MTARAMFRVALLVLLLLIVQTTVVIPLRVRGAHPDLVWLLPITAALIDGPETGAIVGFWSGLAFDLLLPTPLGLSALVGCLLGYATGALTENVDATSPLVKALAALFGSVAADMLFAVLGAIFGQQQMVQIDFVSVAVVVGVSSLIVVFPVGGLMGWCLQGENNRRRSEAHVFDERFVRLS